MIRRGLDALFGRGVEPQAPLEPYLREIPRSPRPASAVPPPPAARPAAPPGPRPLPFLASRDALRQAILVQEILGPPKGLRPDRGRPAAER